jgi:hypothetical protein
MNDYSLALFLHIVGALGFFVALGLEWVSLHHLRRVTSTEQVREWMRVPGEIGRAGMIAMVMLFAAGLYMMATVWGSVAWIMVTLGALALMIPWGMVLTRRRMAAIERMVLVEQGSLCPALDQLLHDPLLLLSLQSRVAMALGIVFLMTVKPELAGSLLTIGLATALGLFSALPILSRERAGRASHIT